MVKDVSVEFRYQRVLLGGSFLDDGEKKRPGKIFTSMSFEEGAADDHSANATSRHLLAQVRVCCH